MKRFSKLIPHCPPERPSPCANPAGTHEAWCNNVRYVCFIQEVGPPHPVKAGQSFSTAFIIGYFDSVEQMQQVYDQHKGPTGLNVNEAGWKLTK